MTAKHVTVEGLAAALHECGFNDDPLDPIDNQAAAILDALPDDCPAEARLGQEKANTLRMGQNWEDALAQRDAAEADAAVLAEALRERHNGWPMCGFDDGTGRRIVHGYADECEVRVMLAAHDRRVKGGE